MSKSKKPSKQRPVLSRRDMLKGAAAAASGSVLVGGAAAAAGGYDQPGNDRWPSNSDKPPDMTLVNGRILTLDDRNTVAAAMAIRDGRIVEIGNYVSRCEQTLDLKGATVVPGLIDSSTRYTRTASEPGYHVRLIETARSIRELQSMIAERAKTVPPGEFITCISGWSHRAFVENRLPTPAELDAVAPRNPVFLAENFPWLPPNLAVANARAAAFFRSQGLPVDPVTGVLDGWDGMLALQAVQSEADKLRATADGLGFAASLGITMINDFGQSAQSQSLEAQFRYVIALWRQKKLQVRIRVRVRTGRDPVTGSQGRILNDIDRLGDDLFRLNGQADGIASSPDGYTPDSLANILPGMTFVAANGWGLSTQALSVGENRTYAGAYRAVNDQYPIKDLRWSLAHVNGIPADVAAALANIGAGVTPSGWQFTYGLDDYMPVPFGPPWRTLLNTRGLRVGAATDAAHSGPFNPWLNIYYMTTGRNNFGQVINPGQTISRLAALQIYTRGSAWHTFDEDQLGTLEVGKLADLAVLSDNPLTVPDKALWNISSVLTLQAGKIVHQTRRFR